ncbi:hypothetical protein TNIN_215191 [Trichonephila inaurata madagascariensis]|uniref:Uncharacterized protein n=1 Tax=Trichonephila inaurata madagascariensis TaxID=2747483 RepID=A0A8X6WLC9_9ARAC|nr:hypothetical protein TNIN_215191 [Trichonephila inaurata madagascariensis]
MTTDRGAVPLVNGVSRASAGKRLGHRLRISRARSLASFSNLCESSRAQRAEKRVPTLKCRLGLPLDARIAVREIRISAAEIKSFGEIACGRRGENRMSIIFFKSGKGFSY